MPWKSWRLLVEGQWEAWTEAALDQAPLPAFPGPLLRQSSSQSALSPSTPLGVRVDIHTRAFRLTFYPEGLTVFFQKGTVSSQRGHLGRLPGKCTARSLRCCVSGDALSSLEGLNGSSSTEEAKDTVWGACPPCGPRVGTQASGCRSPVVTVPSEWPRRVLPADGTVSQPF